MLCNVEAFGKIGYDLFWVILIDTLVDLLLYPGGGIS